MFLFGDRTGRQKGRPWAQRSASLMVFPAVAIPLIHSGLCSLVLVTEAFLDHPPSPPLYPLTLLDFFIPYTPSAVFPTKCMSARTLVCSLPGWNLSTASSDLIRPWSG